LARSPRRRKEATNPVPPPDDGVDKQGQPEVQKYGWDDQGVVNPTGDEAGDSTAPTPSPKPRSGPGRPGNPRRSPKIGGGRVFYQGLGHCTPSTVRSIGQGTWPRPRCWLLPIIVFHRPTPPFGRRQSGHTGRIQPEVDQGHIVFAPPRLADHTEPRPGDPYEPGQVVVARIELINERELRPRQPESCRVPRAWLRLTGQDVQVLHHPTQIVVEREAACTDTPGEG